MKHYFFYFHAFFALCSSIVDGTEQRNSGYLNKAEEFFCEGQYEDASVLLQKSLDLNDSETVLQRQIRLRLSQTYLYLGRLSDAEALIYPFINASTPEGHNALFLSGCIARKKREWKLAEERFQQYPGPEGKYQLGIVLYEQNQYQEAKDVFLSLYQNEEGTLHLFDVHLYLARIALAEKDLAQAEKWLATGKETNETAYLRGLIHLHRGAHKKAASCFENSLSSNELKDSPKEILYLLGKSYLKITDTPFLQVMEQLLYFDKAGKIFELLFARAPTETSILALAEYCVKRGRHLHEPTAYRRAEELLSHPLLKNSKEATILATLLKAEIAPTYHARDTLYLQLLDSTPLSSSYYGKELFLKGLNDFNEGESFLQKKNFSEANGYFERAAEVFSKAYETLKKEDPSLALHSITFVGEARLRQGTPQALIAGIGSLDRAISDSKTIEKIEYPDGIYYLKGTLAGTLAETSEKQKYSHLAEQTLKEGLAQYPAGPFANDIFYMMGTLAYKKGKYTEAESIFLQVAEKNTGPILSSQALYWAAMSAEKQGKAKEVAQNYRRRLITDYPNAPLSAEAYFLCYTYSDYLQGERAAIKHLQGMGEHYPDSPYRLNASYLIGLDYKRDRKTPEGKWIRKRNLTAAIDHFNEVESLYDRLQKNKLISEENEYAFVYLRYRAMLERALANLSIAKESEGAKREIYLEYAEEVFQEMIYDLQTTIHSLASTSLQEEALHWLIQTYLEAGRIQDAESTALLLLEKYKTAKTTRGYFLSRLWYQRGVGALRNNSPLTAIEHFQQAEETGKGKILGVDQRLDLWIQQSACFLALKKYDEAMLLLSKVINQDVVSGLRLKAMFLRAEVYEQQGRYELARKQLEATMKKGGEWAIKAKQKLEAEYAK